MRRALIHSITSRLAQVAPQAPGGIGLTPAPLPLPPPLIMPEVSPTFPSARAAHPLRSHTGTDARPPARLPAPSTRKGPTMGIAQTVEGVGICTSLGSGAGRWVGAGHGIGADHVRVWR